MAEVAQKGRKRATDDQIVDALELSLGIVAQAAAVLAEKYKVKISRSALKRRIDNSKRLTDARNAAEERGLDVAEVALFANIHNGREKSIIFYLQSRHPKYKPQSELTIKHAEDKLSPEELDAEIDALVQMREMCRAAEGGEEEAANDGNP